MYGKQSYQLLACVFAALLFAGITQTALAQQSDTARVTRELEQEEDFFQPYHSERSVGNMYETSRGTYNVPEPKQYYRPPFMGQKYLDMALAAYYEELMEEESLLLKILNAIAPFINNQFEYAIYRVYDLPIVERDHPLLDPQLEDKQ